MEKNLAIIQGLTSADQANPIRITDAGELKITITDPQVARGTDVEFDPVTGYQIKYVNTIAAPYSGANQMYEINCMDGNIDPSSTIPIDVKKLLVEQGKSFITVYSQVFDASAAPGNDIPTSITNAINQWTSAYGARYDDLIITPYVSYDGSGIKYLVGVTIIRYY